MSEYMEIETELSDDGRHLLIYSNLKLAEGDPESYASITEMEVGSPVAQALAMVVGIETLRIDGRDLTITRTPDSDWHIIVAEVSAALKEFFL
jgi:hypothetical protein